MRRLSLLLLFAASLAAALPAAAQQGTPRLPSADSVRFGTTRPAAGDSIAMAEYDEEGEEEGEETAARGEDEAEADTVPARTRSGPYTRAGGTGGPFSVQASGQTAARPPRGEVVWLEGRAARPAASDSSRRDTARAGSGQRVASGQSARRDTASTSATRPARRDTASATAGRPARRDTASASASRPARRDTASSTASRPPRDTISIGSRPAARDTAGARRNGQAASTNAGRTGSASAATAGSTGARTGSSGSSARPRTHTVAAGETFFGIARRYGVTAAQMRAINPDVDQDALEVGDVLRLPASARDSRAGSSSGSASGTQRTGTQAAPRTGSQGAAAQRRSHTVAAGETLFGIARRYGVTVDAIREANDLEGDGLRTGQRLVIPPAR